MLEIVKPMDIEKRSFEIITELLGDTPIAPENELVVKRVIHTSADFDYAKNLVFSEGAVRKGIEALRGGCDIVTDTQMAKAGINKTILGKLGGQVHCFMSDESVAQEAKERGVTRAMVSMERAAQLPKPCIFAIGNAPTALICIRELMDAGKLKPALIVGVPVGFVNVVESKELIMESDRAPYIVARGRKGGSNVAAAICNAMLYQITRGYGRICCKRGKTAPPGLHHRLLCRCGGQGSGLDAADGPGKDLRYPAYPQGNGPEPFRGGHSPGGRGRFLRHCEGRGR